MSCEVCGRKIYTKPHNVVIEGARLAVCDRCSRHGTTVWEKTTSKTLTHKPKTALQPPTIRSQKRTKSIESSLEIIENFGTTVKHAREKRNLSHEELGKKLNEKVSVLKKIERGKITPDHTLAMKLERVLKVGLLVPAAEKKALMHEVLLHLESQP